MQYFDTKTGKPVRAKSSFTVEDRVPPFLPINWLDWLGDEHVREMNAAMRGVYLSILIELWMYDQCSPDHKVLARRIGLDPRPVKAFLEQYGHLFCCPKCGGTMTNLERTSDESMTEVRRNSDECTTEVCRNCDGTPTCVCRTLVGTMTNRKLKNYKNDVKNGLPLGTTKPNLNQTEPESNLYLSPARQGEEMETDEEELNGEDDDYDDLN